MFLVIMFLLLLMSGGQLGDVPGTKATIGMQGKYHEYTLWQVILFM